MKKQQSSRKTSTSVLLTMPKPLKIMSSGPITSWQIHGKTMETVTDFIFLGFKITAVGDCSHEIKRHCSSNGKESACNEEDTSSIPGSERASGEGNGNPLQYSCQESSVNTGYSPWAHKESDRTERLMLFHFCYYLNGECPS